MKKSLSIISALAIALSLTACNDGSNGTVQTESLVQSGNSSDAQSSTQSESPSPASTTSAEDEPVVTNGAKLGEFGKTATITETVLLDEDDVKITATALNYGNYSLELELLIENNSAKDLSFISGSVGYSCNSVNGIMVFDGYLNCDVTAGNKATDTISFNYNNLMLYGINEVADIEIGFDVSDADYNHTYSGPRQVKTSLADTYDYSEKRYQTAITSDECKNTFGYSIGHFSDEELYDENSITIESAALITNKDGNRALLLEVENSSPEQIRFVTGHVSVNGLLVKDSELSYDTINPNKRCIVDVDFSDIMRDSYWDAFGIRKIGEITLDIQIVNADGSTISEAATITVKIPDTNAEFDASGKEVYSGSGIRILSKGVVESGSEYSKDMYALFVIENTNAESVSVDDVYDTLSVNGFMCDYSFTKTTIDGNGYSLLAVKLLESSLEKNNISKSSDISEVEVSIDIKDSSGKKLDSPTVQIKY